MSITIQINRQLVEAEPGEMLISAADRAGVYIPRFCYHPKLSIAANCRMCLVEVGSAPEKPPAGRDWFLREEVQAAPKPLPACATPVAERMVAFTDSQLAREAQKGTLEFLLINHPLDCPVCDQGGECPLQDQAMGYGADDSRFAERKRAVASRDIGPLVATEMTRCIHCTRCVRFGEEVAGVMELGMPGRGESAHISTFLGRTVDSEVSGNMIDLCPVGALTSKPYRFAARAWELQNHRGISPHDCVGANLNVQTLRGRVERVLPRDNPEVNDCWLADRDRYSYQALHSPRRLTEPMIFRNGAWKKASWEDALQYTCDGLAAAAKNGSDDCGVAALSAYSSTLEEYYLLQKLARALGSNHIDHRVQQCDFRDDAHARPFPSSQIPPAEFDALRAALLVGSNLRKEQPLLAVRLRAAVRAGARVCALNPIAYEQNFAAGAIVTGAALPAHLAAVCARIAAAARKTLPAAIARRAKAAKLGKDELAHADAVADALLAAREDASGAVVLGALVHQHPEAAVLRAMAGWICHVSGARLAELAPGNSAAAWQAGCLPHRGPGGAALENGSAPGDNARAMLETPRRAYLLLATEPELDAMNGRAAADALRRADFVARISAFHSDAAVGANVLLPMAAFAESAGTFVNCEGRAQSADAAAAPLGQSRPAWKILRVLGNFLGLPGFDQVTLAQVREEAEAAIKANSATSREQRKWNDWKIPPPPRAARGAPGALIRLADMPMYRSDQTVRHADALQQTADNPPPDARMNRATAERLGLNGAKRVLLRGRGDARLPLCMDERVPAGCVYVPAGHGASAALGAHGAVTVHEKSGKKSRGKKTHAKKSKTGGRR
ncbi:MAG: NADH-quinone oxidoreductase subunit NuoG [Gammaproteobacteria bacterium]|nr:NADH-quinone oxidoreductase subunit NuoG [Gammaproteobacteria bacterium]